MPKKNHSNLQIQKCTKEKYEQARELIQSILRDEFPSELSAYPPDDLKDLSQSYGKLGESFFVALEGDEVVGTVGVKREDDRTALLRRLFVQKDHRGNKLGEQLIEKAISFCKEVGYDELMFKTTSNMQKAIALCEKKGFVPRARLDLGPIKLVKFVLFLKAAEAGLSK